MTTPTVTTLTWAQTAALNPATPICLSCGAELVPLIARAGSRRCPSCRALDTTLQPPLAQPAARRAA